MKLHNIASRCLCLLTGVALFTACDNETDFADPNNRDGKPLRIETSIAETRAVVTSTNFSEGDRIGLFVLDDGGQYYADNAMNQQATYNGAGWDMQSEIVLSKEKTPYVFAVYPYYGAADYMPVDIDTRIRINIAPNQYEGIEGQADWMYANALPMEGNIAKLTFRHALARVTLQLKRGAEEQGDGFLSSVRMQNAMKYDANNAELGKGTDLCTVGWMSLRDGFINTEETKDAESYLELTTEMGLSEEAQAIDFLVIPTALANQTNTPDANTTGGGIEILLTIDGKQYRVDLGVPTWHAGQQYIYPITINRNSAEVTPELTPTEGAYIDLGLPSGTLWASCNVGANSPEEAGGYYAWGETEEKEDYSWGTYNWGTGTFFTKYCTDSSYGTVDGKTTLEPEDDVAYMVLGSEWRMPTQTEVQELQEYCTWTLGEYKGCAGYLIEGSNGNCIFLPFAGAIYDNEHHYESEGYYWTATLGETTSGILNYFNTNSKYYNLGYQRYYGMTVRPIYDPQPTTEPVAEAVDLGLSVKWASFNVGATKPEEAGGYYAWGETEEREDYGESSSLTYDLSESELQSRGIIGANGNLTASYDVASTKWGNNWRMPTQAEIEELRDKCTWKWTTQNGVNGYKVTASNGNFIFLPVAGYHYDTGLDFAGSNGYYWSATPLNNNDFAYSLYFSSSGRGHYTGPRYYGLTVRPIYDPQPTEPVAEAVDLGLSVKWASFNVGATNPEEYGGYYAWGETEEGNYGESSLTYNLSKSELQSRGIISEDGNLTAFYDVATTKWGGAWRMPTLAEIQELINKCTWERTTQNGVNGCKVSGSNGNSIFLPCAGLRLGTTFLEVGTYGHCWSASLDGYDIWYAHQLEFDDSSICWDNYGERGNGYTVRPVTK